MKSKGLEIGRIRYHSTRYPELVYGKIEAGYWSIFNHDGDGSNHQCGPHYSTRAELLGDLHRYASEFGCGD